MSFQTNCSRLPDVSFFLISSFKRSFFLLSSVPLVKVNLKSWTGFTDHKQVGDWSDFNFSLVQLLVFLYRAPGRHWSVEAYHAPRGNTGAWSLEETLFRVCEFKKLHNCCAITRICAGGLTACFPPWALCVCFLPVLLGDSVVFSAMQRLTSVVFCCAFSTNRPHRLLKNTMLHQSLQPASRSSTI